MAGFNRGPIVRQLFDWTLRLKRPDSRNHDWTGRAERLDKAQQAAQSAEEIADRLPHYEPADYDACVADIAVHVLAVDGEAVELQPDEIACQLTQVEVITIWWELFYAMHISKAERGKSEGRQTSSPTPAVPTESENTTVVPVGTDGASPAAVVTH